ncbi:MAG: hypothetical protein LAP61_12740 [Acidobacteriia bacterium]|nr:hypothetical protein [Terriglobia bacterium]
MKAVRLLFLAVFSLAILFAQSADTRIALQDLLDALADPEVAKVPQLSDSILRNGIQFDLKDEVLGKILDAGRQGKRDPKEMATLITVALSACQDCRARYLTPMSLEELQTLLKRFTPEAVSREVRARGVTGLEMSGATANVLRAWGAKEDLIAFLVPDDKIPTIPLQPPYQMAPLSRAQEYDPAAKEGWLRISAELAPSSQTEFFFKHNALFVKPLQGEEPKQVQAYFNKPAPRNKTAEFIDAECGLESPAIACGQEAKDEKRGGLRSVLPKNTKSKAALIEYSYAAPDGDGRAGFQITVANPEKTAQKYSVYLRWRVLDSPKPPPPSLGGKGGKR